MSLALGASERIAVRIDRLLVHTITMAGLAAMVAASYLLIVLGLGRSPTGDEKTLLGLSMLAAAVAALLWIPVRERLTDIATRRVYGERHAPDEVIRTFGSRLTRALPLDELLMQLAESLKKTMSLSVAEVWTRGTGRLERAVSVPERGTAHIVFFIRGLPKRFDLRVRAAGFAVVALADDGAVLHEHRAHGGIRAGQADAA